MEAMWISLSGALLLLIAVGVRIVEYSVSETFASAPLRRGLRTTSYVLFGLAVLSSIAVFNFGLTFLFLIFLFLEADVRSAGIRQRAWQAEFLWVLAIAVKSGRPLSDEIEAYAEGTWGKRHQKLMDMAIRLRHGDSLVDINETLHLLPQSAVFQIYSGISAKSLQDSLGLNAVRLTQELADDQESGYLGAALMYPVALFISLASVNGFLMYYIIPKFKKIFDDFGSELPPITIMMIRCSDTFVNYWYLLGPPIFSGVLLCILLITYSEYHGWRDILRLLFGRLSVRLYSPDVLRSLALWTGKNQPISEAFGPFIKHSGPRNLHLAMNRVAKEIGLGVAWWTSLERAGFLRAHEAGLLELAQRNGNLAWALTTLAESIENRRMFRFRAILEFVQPLSVILIAVAVGFFAISMFMPLIKLLSDLS